MDEDSRVRRRNRACVGTGLALGTAVGAIAGLLAPSGGFVLTLIGASGGVLAGRLIASHISVEEWDPPPNHQSYVGANTPDDDDASP
jgi:hypothetical protein